MVNGAGVNFAAADTGVLLFARPDTLIYASPEC